MGFALPAVLGVADFSRQIVVVVGDGSIMMNIQELETIRAHRIPVKVFVINNNAYAIIRRRQRELFRSRTIGTDPANGVTIPSFAAIAGVFDMKYSLIDSAHSLGRQLREVLNEPCSVLCEIIGNMNQVYTEVGVAKNRIGRLVKRPIEDQWPFLSREVFLSEMIIEPIDQ
jgi:acetolactate synthase-1/2/3 large subunit